MKTLRKPIHDRPHGWLAASLLLALCGPLGAEDLDPQRVGQWPGRPQGSAQAVAVSGQYAFVLIPNRGGAGGLQVLDVSNPANPRRVGGYAMNSYPNGLAVAGDHAYIADGSAGLQVIDISNPAELQRIGSCDLGWKESVQVSVSGHYAYVAGSSNRIVNLHIIDITDPAHPLEAGRCEIRGYLEAVAVSGHHAYVAAYDVDLQVIDVADPANPQPVGHLAGVCGGLATSGQYAYVAGWGLGLRIFDISNPADPVNVSEYNSGAGAEAVAVSGNYAFVANVGWGLEVIDISNPTDPRRVGGCETGDWNAMGKGIAVFGNHAYLADGQMGLQVIDVSNPASPTRVGSQDTGNQAYDLAVAGHYAYLAHEAGGLKIVDISNPADPQRVGGWFTSDWVEAVAVSGHYAYALERWWDDSTQKTRARLHVIDVSNPTNAARLGGLEDLLPKQGGGLGDFAGQWAVLGNYAYVLTEDRGLEVIDVSDPANPRRAGEWPDGRSAEAVAVSGNYACLADSVGLQVIDISDPANPRRVGGLEVALQEWSDGVAVAGRYAYLAGRWYDQAAGASRDGLQVIDISDPANPRLVGQLGGMSGRVVVSRNHAFTYGSHGGMVVDITDPAHPQRVGYCGTSGWVGGAAFSANNLYLATLGNGQAFLLGEGLLVFDISVLANPQRVGSHQTRGTASRLAVLGNYAYVVENPPEGGTNHLLLVNISKPVDPQPVGRWSGSGWIEDVAVSGDYAYVAAGGNGLEVLDIRNPSVPVEVGWFVNATGYSAAVAVSGPYAYSLGGWPEGTNWLDGLQVIDVSDPSHPQWVGSLPGAPVAPAALAVSGNYACVAGSWAEGTNWVHGLQVIDISNPAHPQRIGACVYGESTWSENVDVALSGHHAYVASGRGLLVIDVSDPAHPSPVSAYGPSLWHGGFRTVVVSGSYAYLSLAGFGRQGLEVLDISDPAHPRRVGGNSVCAASDLAIAGNLVYAASDDGLVILNTYQPPPRIESAEFGDDGFRLVFRGEAGRTIRLQRSPDLKTWEDWVILTATGDSQAVADPSADSHPCQFYRAVGE